MTGQASPEGRETFTSTSMLNVTGIFCREIWKVFFPKRAGLPSFDTAMLSSVNSRYEGAFLLRDSEPMLTCLLAPCPAEVE